MVDLLLTEAVSSTERRVLVKPAVQPQIGNVLSWSTAAGSERRIVGAKPPFVSTTVKVG
jgi:hypothetical protein